MGRKRVDVNVIRSCFESLPSRMRNKLFNDIYEEYYALPGGKKSSSCNGSVPLLQCLLERVLRSAEQAVRLHAKEKVEVWLKLVQRLAKIGCVAAMPALYDQLVTLVLEVLKEYEDTAGKGAGAAADALRALIAVDLSRRARASAPQRCLARMLTAAAAAEPPARMRYLALGALARLADNTAPADVRELVEPCLKDALPAALRAFASRGGRVSVAGLLALRALAVGPPHHRGPPAPPHCCTADALTEDALRTAACFCDADAVATVAAALRSTLWDAHVRARGENGALEEDVDEGGGDGGGGGAEGDAACESAARALAAVGQGLRGRSLPPHALRALQMAVATAAVEAEMLVSSEGWVRAEGVFRAAWRHILSLRRGLYPGDRLLEPSAGAAAGLAGPGGAGAGSGGAETALRRLAPWKPHPHPARAVPLLGEREASRRATRLLRAVADRLAAARAAARALAPHAAPDVRRTRLCASCQRDLSLGDRCVLDSQSRKKVCARETSTADLQLKLSHQGSGIHETQNGLSGVFENSEPGSLTVIFKKEITSRKREHGGSTTTGTTDTE